LISPFGLTDEFWWPVQSNIQTNDKQTPMRNQPTVARYIADAPPKARKALKAMRTAIRGSASGITERISYRIPTFDLDGKYLLYIAAFRDHVSVYPVTRGMVAKHGDAIAKYRHGKGTLRFPLDKPVPIALIRKLAKARVAERQNS
jgi:uncharacterized protein YdhG (YjbR/CyaY superfamily)